MKQFFLYLTFLIFFSSPALSQKISGKITYINTLRQSLYISGSSDNMDTAWLYFNDTLSTYVVDTKLVVDEKKIMQQLQGLNVSQDEIKKATTQAANFYNENRLQYSYRQNGSTSYYRPWRLGNLQYCRVDSLPDLNWELHSDTMRILGFLCQKATSKSVWEDSYFRQFTAWFTLEIPLAYGPKNVFGLPGIVLSADSKFHHYEAVAVKIPLEEKDISTLSKCKDLPIITAVEADKKASKLKEDLINMQKLRNN